MGTVEQTRSPQRPQRRPVAARPEHLAGLSRPEILRASPPMFDSPWLDRLSRVHWAVVPLIFVPAIVVFAILSLSRLSVGAVLAWVLVGYLVWTLTEYWLHRLVFHFEPDGWIGGRLHWIIHGVHHDHPSDPMRLVMPPSVSVPLASLFTLAFYALLGSHRGPALAVGFFAGYLFYDMAHYYVHHHRPKSALGRTLRELHMRHHFQDHETGFGVSAPWWDLVFGTAPKRRVRKISE